MVYLFMLRKTTRSSCLTESSTATKSRGSNFSNRLGSISIVLLVILLVFLVIPSSPLEELSNLGLFKKYLIGHLSILIILMLIVIQRNKMKKQPVKETVWNCGWKKQSNEVDSKEFSISESVYASCRIGFVAKPDEESHRISSELLSFGLEVHLSLDIKVLTKAMEENRVGWSIMLLDLDQYSDIKCAIEDLLEFRAIFPNIAIVLLSSDVGRDDLSLERKAVADVTLRKPVSKRRLRNGLFVARVNANFRLGRLSGSLD